MSTKDPLLAELIRRLTLAERKAYRTALRKRVLAKIPSTSQPAAAVHVWLTEHPDEAEDLQRGALREILGQ